MAASNDVLEATVRTKLIAHLGLTSLLGAGSASRFRARMAEPNETRPYVVCTVVSNQQPAQSAGGLGKLHQVHFQFDCVGDTPKAAKQLADCFTGSTTGPTGGALITLAGHADDYWRIARVFVLEAGRDDYDPPQNAGERGLFRTIVEAEVWAYDIRTLASP